MTTKTSMDIDASVAAANTDNGNEPIIPLEDCKCPICLDYFIDVVETRCRHRFCSFCLENWLHVSATRQCPTCRRSIQEPVHVKVDLQEAINACIHPTLTEDVLRERLQIRAERQAQSERFSADIAQTHALISRITSSRHRNRINRMVRRSRRSAGLESDLRSREARTPFLSRHIMNWWDDINSTMESEGHPYSDSVLNEVDTGSAPLDWYNRFNSNEDRSAYFASASQESLMTTPLPNMSRNVRLGTEESHQRAYPRDFSFDQAFHEDLMREYGYHFQRVNYAHARIREAYRDFNYHNERMQEILHEHRVFFSSTGTAVNRANSWSHNNDVGYGNYDLTRAEVEEFLDLTPDARAFLDELIADHTAGSTESSNFHNRRYGSASTDGSGRNVPIRRPHSYNVSESLATTHLTNTSDIRHEVNSRRTQPNTFSAYIRQYPLLAENSREHSFLNRSSGSISTLLTHRSNPVEFWHTHPESSNDPALPRVSGQQSVVERLVGTGSNYVRSSRGRRCHSAGNRAFPPATLLENSVSNTPMSEMSEMATLNEVGTSGNDASVSYNVISDANIEMPPNTAITTGRNRRRQLQRSTRIPITFMSSDSENEDERETPRRTITRSLTGNTSFCNSPRTSPFFPSRLRRLQTAPNAHCPQHNFMHPDTEDSTETTRGSSRGTNESTINGENSEIQNVQDCVINTEVNDGELSEIYADSNSSIMMNFDGHSVQDYNGSNGSNSCVEQ